MTYALTNCKVPEMLQVSLTNPQVGNKVLFENMYTLIGTFIKNSEASFYDLNSACADLVNFLFEGYNSIPKIKKISTDNFKLLKEKLDKEGSPVTFEQLLKFSFKNSEEEAKNDGPESPNGSAFDKQKVDTIMKAFATKAPVKVAPKKDFRAFLKQQKTVVAKVEEDIKVVVQGETKMEE